MDKSKEVKKSGEKGNYPLRTFQESWVNELGEKNSKYYGKSPEQIASMLDNVASNLHRWAREARNGNKKYAGFDETMDKIRNNRISCLINDIENNLVTEKGVKFSENSAMFLVKMAGYGRRLPELYGVENELQALQIVQDALSESRISEEFAESCAKTIQAKVQVRQVLEMKKDIDQIKQTLGLE